MKIRQETEQDFDEIYTLIQTAFKTAKVSDGSEQDFAVGLRNGENYIPELALVAEKDNRLIGHIMLTKIYVKQDDRSFEGLLLAPISILLEYRNQGLGSMLIEKSLALAKDMGYTAVFLVGDPAYYHRFGFGRSADYGIKYADNIPDRYVMVRELVPHALNGVTGTFKS